MKTKTTIIGMCKEDLINLFSTALYGNNWLVADYDYDKYKSLFDENDVCYEDRLAKILLNDGTIELVDMYSSDKEEGAYGSSKRVYYDEERSAFVYPINYSDIVIGLQNALDKNVTCHCNEEDWLCQAAMRFVNESSSFDLADADALMQAIMFNELVYG